MNLKKLRVGQSELIIAGITERGMKSLSYRDLKELEAAYKNLKSQGRGGAFVNQCLKSIGKCLTACGQSNAKKMRAFKKKAK